MKKLLRFWNLVHYCMFKLQFSIHRMLSILNPMTYFLKIPTVKKAFEKKRNINDISEYIEKSAFKNPETSVTIIWAGIHTGALLILAEYLGFNLIQISLKKDWMGYIMDNDFKGLVFIFSLIIPVIVINYFALFRNKKYLLYFKEFDEIPRYKLNLYCFFCMLAYLSMAVFLILSFTWQSI